MSNPKNLWVFCGGRIIVDVLTANTDLLLPMLEAEASNVAGERLKEIVLLGDQKFEICGTVVRVPRTSDFAGLSRHPGLV